nr:MAG TPA: hypothetical protein [Caudoviricetes sp.]
MPLLNRPFFILCPRNEQISGHKSGRAAESTHPVCHRYNLYFKLRLTEITIPAY